MVLTGNELLEKCGLKPNMIAKALESRLVKPILQNRGWKRVWSKEYLGSDKNGLSFRIKKILLESGIETSKLEWDPEPISESADFFLNQEKSYKKPSKTDEAEYWLMERLEEGPQPAGDLIRIGEEFGYTPKILRDAGERFNMERYKDGLDHWMWKLPNFKHKSDDQTS